MNRLLFSVAFLLGAGAITWVAAGFLGKDTLALAVTVIIALVFVLGISELLQPGGIEEEIPGTLVLVSLQN